MSAGVYDFKIEQGVPFTFQVQYQNPDGSGKNITSWVVVGSVKEKVNDCNVLGELDIEITEPLTGILTVTVPKEIGEKVKVRGTKYSDYGTLVYDIKLWPLSDLTDIRRLLNGVISVSPQVTK